MKTALQLTAIIRDLINAIEYATDDELQEAVDRARAAIKEEDPTP